MTWGSGVQGCLGHGTTSDSPKAKVVEDLVGCTVVQLSCGAAHVMALTSKYFCMHAVTVNYVMTNNINFKSYL